MQATVVFISILCLNAGLSEGANWVQHRTVDISSADHSRRALRSSDGAAGISVDEVKFGTSEALYSREHSFQTDDARWNIVQREDAMKNYGSTTTRQTAGERNLLMMIKAIRVDDSTKAKSLLSGGVHANARYSGKSSHSTPLARRSALLHWAGYYNASECAKVLIKQGAIVDILNADKQTPLHVASEFGDKEVAEVLLRAGADVDVEDRNHKTPLMLSVDEERIDMISFLVHFGKANIDSPNSSGQTALHEAIALGKVNMVQALVESGAKIDVPNRSGYTPLHAAVCRNQYLIVKYLLSRGANVELVDSMQGWTPLLDAATYGYTKIVKALLRSKADPNKMDFQEWSPLHAAARYKHASVVKVLLSHGANPNIASEDGWTPLHEAASVGSLEVAEILVRKGASLTNKCEGMTPYDLICQDPDRSNCSEETKHNLENCLKTH